MPVGAGGAAASAGRPMAGSWSGFSEQPSYADVVESLFRDFEHQHRLSVITATVRLCYRQLHGVYTSAAWPEFTIAATRP